MLNDTMNTDCCISCCRAGIKQVYKDMTFALYYEVKDNDGNDTYEIYYCYMRGNSEREILERLPAAIQFEIPQIIPRIFKIEKAYDNENFIPFWEKEIKYEQLNIFG